MIVIFEGPDAAGKDTIRAEFESYTKYKHTCVTRMHLSQIVFARYYRRPLWHDVKQRSKYLREFALFLRTCRPLIVSVTADIEKLRERILARGERVEDNPDIGSSCGLFYEEVRKLPEEYWMEVDTTQEPPLETIAKRIVRKIG